MMTFEQKKNSTIKEELEEDYDDEEYEDELESDNVPDYKVVH